MHTRNLLLTSLLLAGCGSSTDVTADTAPAPASLPASALARVVDDRGAPVANAEIVLHERVTNLKYVLASDAQGSFALDMPPGVYDVGLNSLDPNIATCFYGPVTLPAGAGRTFVLHDAGGRPAGTVFGRIDLQPGRPATARRIVLIPTQTSSTVDPLALLTFPAEVQLQTLADGSFQATLAADGPVGLDVEVYNADGNLDEIIDVSTLAKPCYLEFAIEESAVINRLRSHESDGPNSVVLANAPPAVTRDVRGKLVTKFTAEDLLDHRTVFLGGQLTGDPAGQATQYSFPELAESGPVDSLLSGNLISVALNGSWWNHYAVNVYSSVTGVGGTYTFADESNTTHTLKFGKTTTVVHGVPGLGISIPSLKIPVIPAWYKLSYTSKQPTIEVILAQPQP